MKSVKKSIDETTQLKRVYDRRVNKRLMQTQESKVDSSEVLDASLVVTAGSGTKSDKHDTSSSSGTYITHAVDADIRLVNDQVPFAEVDNNTTPDSTNMSHRGGDIDHDAEQYQVKSPLLNDVLFKTKEMIEKETYNELSHRVLLLEKHCISLELEIQQKDNQIKSVKEASNEAKVKNDVDVIETINIELEHSVAKLLAANEQLHKENEHLKQTYKELYDSIKKTCVQNKDNSDSLISQINQKSVKNADLKAQIQEKFVKPHHVIASGSSRNSSKESYGSNDITRKYYLEEAKKKTQKRDRNSKPSVMHTTSLQNTTNGSKTKPRSNNQTSRSFLVPKSSREMLNGVPLVDYSWNSSSFSDSKHFVCSTCQKCVFNANHDDCRTKFLKEVNSRAKVQSAKSRNNIKPVKRIHNVNKPKRWISKGYRFSPNKSSAVWIPTGKMFTDNTTKVDNEPPNGSNDDITNPYECDQTLNVSAGTLNLSAGLALQRQNDVCSHQFRPRSS
ncbi:hypothetical protein Tco_1532970, partial [Tanacetum coccineum]